MDPRRHRRRAVGGRRAGKKGSRGAPAAPASTTHTRAWQHPYVDVFKTFKVGDWTVADKLGDVTRVLDPDIGKAAFRIVGNVAASNCIHIPRGIKSTSELTTASRTVSRGSLNLTGRFVYVQLKPTGTKYTTLHLDVCTTDKFVYRLSFSNVFRKQRLVGQVAQIPTHLRQRWTVFAVDLPAVLEAVTDGTVPAAAYLCLKGIQLCANMVVRNVYTSDILYTAESLPREISLPVPAPTTWADRYDFVWVPAEPDVDLQAAASPSPLAAASPQAAGAAQLETALASPPRPVPAMGGDDPLDHPPRASPELKARYKAKSPVAQGHQGARRRSQSRSPGGVVGAGAGAGAGAGVAVHAPAVTGARLPSPPELQLSQHPVQPPPQSLRDFTAEAATVHGATPAGRPPIGSELSEPSVWEADDAAAAAEADLASPQRTGHAVLTEAQNIMRRAGVSPRSTKGSSASGKRSTVPVGVLSSTWPTQAGEDNVPPGTHPAAVAPLAPGTSAWPPPAAGPLGPPGAADARAQRAEQAAILQPDPIMTLSHVVGFEGSQPGCVLWSMDGEELVFACSNLVVAMRHDDDRDDGGADADGRHSGHGGSADSGGRRRQPHAQRHFMGHTNVVTSLCLSSDGALLVTGQAGHHPAIRVWDFRTTNCLAVLGGHTSSLGTLSLSADDSMLVAPGLDAHARLLLIVWDVSRVASGEHEPVARQVADFPVTRIRFSPYDAAKLVSCGRENVRFWRIKRGHLPGCPVILNQYARGCEFTDVAFEANYGGVRPSGGGGGGGGAATDGAAQRRVFVSSAVGTLIQVNYDTRELECVYRLHDGPIHSLAVNEGFCVTASADAHLRVWPLDFSDFFLEARNDGGVTSAVVSPDGLKIGLGTAAGSLGVLDIATHAFSTLLRAHTADVLAVAVRPATAAPPAEPELATVSLDGTLRVWHAGSGDQLVEFSAPGEVSRCVVYHPAAHVVACGYEAGTVRVFDVPATCMVEEYPQHRGPVRDLAFSPDGTLLFSAAGDGLVCVYDAAGTYSPLKMLSADLPATVVDAAAALAMAPDGRSLAVAFSAATPPPPAADALRSPPPAAEYTATGGSGRSATSSSGMQPVVLVVDPPSLNRRATLTLPVYPSKRGHAVSRMLPSALSLPVSATGLVATVTGPGVRTAGGMARSSHAPGAGAVERRYRGLGADATAPPPPPIVTQLGFTPDGTQLVATTSDCRVVRWAAASGAVVREVRSIHRGPVCGMDVSPNGTFLVTGGDDQVVKVWDLVMRGPPPPLFQSFVGHNGAVRAVHFLPSGQSLVSVGAGSGALFMWRFHGDTTVVAASEAAPHADGVAGDATAPSRRGPGGVEIVSASAETVSASAEGAAAPVPPPVATAPAPVATAPAPVATAPSPPPLGPPAATGGDGSGDHPHGASGADDDLDTGAPRGLVSAPQPEPLPVPSVVRSRSPSRVAELGLVVDRSTISLADTLADDVGGVEVDGVLLEDAGGAGAAAATSAVAGAPAGAADRSTPASAAAGHTDTSGASAGGGRQDTTSDDIWSGDDDGGDSVGDGDGVAVDDDTASYPEWQRTHVSAMDPTIRGCLFWHPPSAVFGFAAGRTVITEGLATRQQTVLEGCPADIQCVALSPAGNAVAAGSDGVVVWRLNGDTWAFGGRLHVDDAPLDLPVVALAFSPDGSRLAAAARPGASAMRLLVAVWDVSPAGAALVASRTVVLAASTADASAAVVTQVEWASPSRFVAVGACGACEFEVVEASDATATAAALRHRTVINPSSVPAGAVLTSVAFRCEVATGRRTPLSEFVAGDTAGSLWVGSPDAATDGHTVTHLVPAWPGVPASVPPPAVTCVTWRGDLLVAGTSAGRVTAFGLAHGTDTRLPVRGLLALDAPVCGMQWDAAGMEGVVLTSSGTAWFSRWGVEPSRLVAAHTAAVTRLAAAGHVLLSVSPGDGSVRVWEPEEWEQVLALDTAGGVPRVVAAASASPDAVHAAVGFDDGSLRCYDLTAPAASATLPSLHAGAVTAVTWVGEGDRRAVVSGDASGRVYVTPVAAGGDGWGTPTRLDKLHVADDVAVAHKYHAITGLDTSPFDPYMFMVSSANGRVSVWSVAPGGPALVAALVLNYAVGDMAAEWEPLVAPGTAVPHAATFAHFSRTQPSVVVCVGPADAAGGSGGGFAGAPVAVQFHCLEARRRLARLAFPEAVSAVQVVPALGLLALAAADSGIVYLLSCAPGNLGRAVGMVSDDGVGNTTGGSAMAAVQRRPRGGDGGDDDDAAADSGGDVVLVTTAGPYLQAWEA